ncbi:hypothetical protein [Deinococcus koreensis]|uniref:hypothetical protein n=1 Tax=Deinococcus koreensis TaxID=2054903 RepID=UPI0010572A3A|nr:hypothetical protein [Deinococcus koreensis]
MQYTLNWPPAGFTAQLWCDELPEHYQVGAATIPFVFAATGAWEARTGALSQWWPGNIRQFGLLGGTFTPNDSEQFSVFLPELVVDDLTAYEQPYERLGLPDEYRSFFIRGLTEQEALPSGELQITVAAHDIVGSSQMSFLFAAQAFFKFMSLPDWTLETLSNRNTYGGRR